MGYSRNVKGGVIICKKRRMKIGEQKEKENLSSIVDKIIFFEGFIYYRR